jgi:hypothetical protein
MLSGLVSRRIDRLRRGQDALRGAPAHARRLRGPRSLSGGFSSGAGDSLAAVYTSAPNQSLRSALDVLQRLSETGVWKQIEHARRASEALAWGQAEHARGASEALAWGQVEHARRASETLARGQIAHSRQALENLARAIPHEDRRRVSELLAKTYLPPHVRQAIDQLARIQRFPAFEQYASAGALAGAAVRFADQIEEADGWSEPDPQGSVGWWLATRTLRHQLALLYAGVEVLISVEALLEEASEEDVPGAVLAGARLCLAMVVFLVLCIDERGKAAE